jgi:hypothetical protein
MSSSHSKHRVRLETQLGGGCRLHVRGVYFDLEDFELLQLGEDVLRQLAAMSRAQLEAAEAAAASMAKSR